MTTNHTIDLPKLESRLAKTSSSHVDFPAHPFVFNRLFRRWNSAGSNGFQWRIPFGSKRRFQWGCCKARMLARGAELRPDPSWWPELARCHLLGWCQNGLGREGMKKLRMRLISILKTWNICIKLMRSGWLWLIMVGLMFDHFEICCQFSPSQA